MSGRRPGAVVGPASATTAFADGFARDPRVLTENTGADRVGMLKSVQRLVGGVRPTLEEGPVRTGRTVPAAERRAGVRYLLGEGAASLEACAAPAIVDRVVACGGERALEGQRAGIVTERLSGPNVAQLDSQRRRDPAACAPADPGLDLIAAV